MTNQEYKIKRLDGNIGLLVAGKGLVFYVMDLIAEHGGKPANFIDTSYYLFSYERSKEIIEQLFNTVDFKVLVVFVFGGLSRPDLVAKALLEYMSQNCSSIPVCFKSKGHYSQESKWILKNMSGHKKIHVFDDSVALVEKSIELSEVR